MAMALLGVLSYGGSYWDFEKHEKRKLSYEIKDF